jgi:hypothetical protein
MIGDPRQQCGGRQLCRREVKRLLVVGNDRREASRESCEPFGRDG